MKNTVLKVSNLTKQYKELTAVNNLNFSLYEGEIVGFIGANGAGKSTTIKLITGLIKPTSGKIQICGQDIQNREKALANIGAIVEAPHFYEYMSAKQNLQYFASYFDKVDSKRIDEILKLIGLFDRKDDRVGKYSLGMKQRLGIGQALLNNPKLLILDEPTNGLDAEGIIQIRKFLKELAAKTNVTIFISSHILSELQNLCDRFIIIDKGKIKDEFDKNHIASISKNQINTFINLNNPQRAAEILKTQFSINCKIKENKIYLHCEKEDRAKIISLLAKNDIEVYGFGNVKVALEQKFLNTIANKKKKD